MIILVWLKLTAIFVAVVLYVVWTVAPPVLFGWLIYWLVSRFMVAKYIVAIWFWFWLGFHLYTECPYDFWHFPNWYWNF